MNYGVSVLSYLPMRREPSEVSEMISQVLFGELYRVTGEREQWLQIVTDFDHYGGWISRNQHTGLSSEEYEAINRLSMTVVPNCFAQATEPATGMTFMISAGSELRGWDMEHRMARLGSKYLHVNNIKHETGNDDAEHLLHTAMQFLHTTYLWGGRSSFGFDCSGFVQTVFKIHRRFLPRDAGQQVMLGTEVPSLEESEPCDLVFFTNGGRKVCHTGMLISRNEIIHCSGNVRTDRIDINGIFKTEDNQYSHTCFVIRRILQS